MEYRAKAAIVIALIFFFLLATVTAVYFGVRVSTGEKAGESYEGGIMVSNIVNTGTDRI